MNKQTVVVPVALLTALLLQLAVAPVVSNDASTIDWKKARELLDKRNTGQPLTQDEQSYLMRAMQAKQGAPGGAAPSGGGPSKPPGPVDFAAMGATTGTKVSSLSAADLRVPALPPPAKYEALHTLEPRKLPPLPELGPAGSVITDPAFGSRILRVTQSNTILNPGSQSFYTTSSSWQNTWNANSTLFFVMAQSGCFLPFKFNPATFEATRIKDPSRPSDALVLKFRREPNFSFKDPAILYGVSTDLELTEYDFAANRYTPLLDLKKLVPKINGYDTDGVSSSANDELVVAFNGPGQDRLMNVVWFDKTSGGKHVLDLANGMIDGKPSKCPLGKGGAHHASIAKGGRYVNVINQGVGNVVWDTQTGDCTMITVQAAAHGAGGYGSWINYATLADNSGQGWLKRGFAPADLARPKPALPRTPHFWGDSHPSWNNVQPGEATPFFTAVYAGNRQAADKASTPLPLMGEIIAVSTDGSGKIWRFAHHRSAINSGTSLQGGGDFWSTPRGNISQDGRFFLFDSNWDDTLGNDPRGGFRKDVFVAACR